MAPPRRPERRPGARWYFALLRAVSEPVRASLQLCSHSALRTPSGHGSGALQLAGAGPHACLMHFAKDFTVYKRGIVYRSTCGL